MLLVQHRRCCDLNLKRRLVRQSLLYFLSQFLLFIQHWNWLSIMRNHFIHIHVILTSSLNLFLFTLLFWSHFFQAYLYLLFAAWLQVLLNNLLSHLVKVKIHNLHQGIQLILSIVSAAKESYRWHQLLLCQLASCALVNAFQLIMLTEVVGAFRASLRWDVGWRGGSRRCALVRFLLICKVEELLAIGHLLDQAFLSCLLVCQVTIHFLSLPLPDLPEPLVDLLLAQAQLFRQFLAHLSVWRLPEVVPQGLIE